MSKHISEQVKIYKQDLTEFIKIYEQELIEFERWAEDNFISLPHAVQMMLIRGHRATEARIEELKLMGY